MSESHPASLELDTRRGSAENGSKKEMSTLLPIRDGIGRFILPHISGEEVRACLSSFETSIFLGEGHFKASLEMPGKLSYLCNPNLTVSNGNISLSHLSVGVKLGFNEYGGIDQFIVLQKKPQSNELIFDVDTELIGYEQPELTPQEIVQGCFRPPHVVGSLAFYHPTRGRMVTPWEVSHRITTGKVLHAYAILGNNRFWCRWSIRKGGQYVLTIPEREWANPLNYPLTISPVGDTFGYTTQGNSYASETNQVDASEASCSAVGTGTSITIYVNNASDLNTRTVKTALYDCPASLTFNLITNGNAGSQNVPPATQNWYTCSFSTSPTLAIQNYRLAGIVSNSTLKIAYDTTGVSSLEPAGANYYTNFPATSYTAPSSGGGRQRSIYATYTPGGGAAFIPHIMMG